MVYYVLMQWQSELYGNFVRSDIQKLSKAMDMTLLIKVVSETFLSIQKVWNSRKNKFSYAFARDDVDLACDPR